MTQGESQIPQAILRPAKVAPVKSALLFMICAIGCASANEFTRSNDLRVVAPARCGESDSAASGAGSCVRITGYIAAGAISAPSDGIDGRPAPFGVVATPGLMTGLGAFMATIIDQPAGARPTSLQTTHNE